jgi:hypothetical protein
MHAGRKIVVSPSADTARLSHFIISKKIFVRSEQPSRSADGRTIMKFPCFTRDVRQFLLSTLLFLDLM